MAIVKYRSWEEACRYSKRNVAIGVGHMIYKNKIVKIEIAKPYYGDAKIYYFHTAIPIRKATVKEVDRIKEWAPW